MKLPSLDDLKNIDVASLVGKVAKAVDGSTSLDGVAPSDALGQRIAEAEKLLSEIMETQKAQAEKVSQVHQHLVGIFSDLNRLRDESSAGSDASAEVSEPDSVEEPQADPPPATEEKDSSDSAT